MVLNLSKARRVTTYSLSEWLIILKLLYSMVYHFHCSKFGQLLSLMLVYQAIFSSKNQKGLVLLIIFVVCGKNIKSEASFFLTQSWCLNSPSQLMVLT